LPKPKADKLAHPLGSSNLMYWMYKRPLFNSPIIAILQTGWKAFGTA
jgi:hypothetical protein